MEQSVVCPRDLLQTGKLRGLISTQRLIRHYEFGGWGLCGVPSQVAQFRGDPGLLAGADSRTGNCTAPMCSFTASLNAAGSCLEAQSTRMLRHASNKLTLGSRSY